MTVNHMELPHNRLLQLAGEAVSVGKMASKHRKSLSGDNFYAQKIAELRADAILAVRQLSSPSADATASLSKLVDCLFSTKATPKERTAAYRDANLLIKTEWAKLPLNTERLEEGSIFPLARLKQTGRAYLQVVGKQINGTYSCGWYDACAVMMRRLLESVIIEAFEGSGIAGKAKNSSGDFLDLTPLIAAAMNETSWNLPRNVRHELPKNLRDLGHRSAHNRYYTADKTDIDKASGAFRETIETFLHLAKLL